MAEALDAAAYIYEGIWVDWTQGRVQGLTWTLCPKKATLLTNMLALFVTLAGGQLWTIIRFALHQSRASRRSGERSDSYPEQQIILRNTATDLHTMRLMSQLAWSLRKRGRRTMSYPSCIAAFAFFHYSLFLLAGTLSNNLLIPGSGGTFTNMKNASSNVLSRSKHCGVWESSYYDNIVSSPGTNIATLDTVRLSQEYLAKTDNNVQLSLEYARECYESEPCYYISSRCDTLPKANLTFVQKPYKASCPFGPQMCHDEQASVVLDTQMIDSHHDLGINAPRKDRITYSRRTTCAVLNDTEHITETNKSSASAIAYANYGSNLMLGTDYTYSCSNYSSSYTDFAVQVTIPYQVNTQTAYGVSPATEYLDSFVPLPELHRKDADLMLFFLSFNGRYFEPINDPWFAAHEFHHEDVPVLFAQRQYARDRMISTLGCLEQHQFCTANEICTPFLGWGQVQDVESFTASLNPHQKVTLDRMLRAVYASSIAQVTTSLAITSTPLLAIDQAVAQKTVLSLQLPDDQWQRELRYWHSIAMAQLQRTIIQWSTGQIAPEPESQIVPAETEVDRWFCRNLMIPSTRYQSFSVLWLALIVGAGISVILVSWTIEETTGWVQLRWKIGSASTKIWDEHHMLKHKSYLNRRSWKPRPPTKDFGVPSESRPRTSEYTSPSLPSPVHHIYRSSNTPQRRPHFPRYHAPQNTSRDHENVELQALAAISTPRLWSDLPHEPVRDSWVASSPKGFDPTGAASPRDTVFTDADERALPQFELDRAVPALELSNLRAHALARNQN